MGCMVDSSKPQRCVTGCLLRGHATCRYKVGQNYWEIRELQVLLVNCFFWRWYRGMWTVTWQNNGRYSFT